MLQRALDHTFPDDVRQRITILTIARTMANGCFRFAAPFIATIAHGQGVSVGTLGLALAVSELAGLASPLVGELVERLHRRTAMALGLTGVAVGASMAAASVHPAMFTVALIILMQSKTMFDLGLGAWVSDRVPYERRGRVMGLTETSWAMGLLLGVTVMGLVTAATNWRVGYGVGAAAVLAMAGFIARGIAPDSGQHTSAGRARQSFRIPSYAWVFIAAWFCLVAAAQSLFVTFGSWLQDSFDFSALNLSVVTFGLGFGELFASLLSARNTDRWGKERSAGSGALVMSIAACGAAAWHGHLWIALPFVVVSIAAFEFAIVSAIPLATALLPGSPARGMALLMGAGTMGRALADVPATRLYDHFGFLWPTLMCVGFGVLSVIAFRATKRSNDRRLATADT